MLVNHVIKKKSFFICVDSLIFVQTIVFLKIFLGFVGSGMLTASVAGSIFAAPPSIHITQALQCIAENNKGSIYILYAFCVWFIVVKNVSLTSHYRLLLAGILVVVPNYTGDCLNFGIAIKKAQQAGIKVIKSQFRFLYN